MKEKEGQDILVTIVAEKVKYFRALYEHLSYKTMREELIDNPLKCQKVVEGLIGCIPLSPIDFNPKKVVTEFDHGRNLEEIFQFAEKHGFKIQWKEALYNALDTIFRLAFSADISKDDLIKTYYDDIKACFEDDASEYSVDAFIGFACYKYGLITFDFTPDKPIFFKSHVNSVMKTIRKDRKKLKR